ncbi:trypsin-like peptidase domain-containing protein [Streptomyces sp. NPDC050161]|uniref:S1C family serine protease n=1 Tax=Streptomyces sp. NPDC050161 TaxID=3365604 RepID=UPI0037B3282F
MDDGTVAGSKPKWWSRQGRAPETQPAADTGPHQPLPPAEPETRRQPDEAAPGAHPEIPGQGTTPDSAPEMTTQMPVAAPSTAVTPAAAPATPEGSGAPATGPQTAVQGDGAVGVDGVDGADAAGPGSDDAAAPPPGTGTVPPAPDAAPRTDSSAALTPAPAPEAPPARPQPLHAEDPYGTPPYGGPGPWAPAPPVQRPVTAPAPGGGTPPGPLPAYGAAVPGAMPPQAPMPNSAYPEAPQRQAPVPLPAAAPPAPQGPGAAADEQPVPGRAPGEHPLPAERPMAQRADAALPPHTERPVPEGGFMPQPGDGGPRPAAARAAGTDRPAPGAQPLAGHAPEHAPGHPAGHPATPPPPQGAWGQYDPWSPPVQSGPAVPPPARRSRRGLLVVGAVVLALLAGAAGGGIGAYAERHGGINDITLPQDGGEPPARDPHSIAGIAQTALPGVVTLHVRGNSEQGTGTGFVLDGQGHILTNNHVVEPAGNGGEISVTFSGGQTAKGRVVGQDGGYDLAVVQVDGVSGLRPLALGDSDAVRVGDPVVAIGAPYDLANTVTAGIISAKQRPITAGGEKADGSDVSYVDALQTDAPINPGNSGGPLVDARARVIGINSAIRAADSGGGPDGGAAGQGGSIGLGFAIPINQAKRVAEELINTGRATHPVIGVTLEMGYPGDGARVSDLSRDGKEPVTAGGPGAKAGIKGGDVITRVDGAPVHSSEELIVKIRSHRPGDTLTLTVRRGGKERTVRLTLGSSSTS